MKTVETYEEYLAIDKEDKYFVCADYTKMNQVQKDYIKVRVGGFYGNTVFAIMYKAGKPDDMDNPQDFLDIGFEEIDGELVATGITHINELAFGSVKDGQEWVKQFNLDNPSESS